MKPIDEIQADKGLFFVENGKLHSLISMCEEHDPENEDLADTVQHVVSYIADGLPDEAASRWDRGVRAYNESIALALETSAAFAADQAQKGTLSTGDAVVLAPTGLGSDILGFLAKLAMMFAVFGLGAWTSWLLR